uniref:Dynein light chain n=1 Tax=Tetraselmis sp. GSL018 TaxID=582737 RepID=A0A061RAZ4_9CHLO|mmetsp:Transcript_32358/g.76828  ORF Transcript_32358/g.76828 Transcript_32358/m.76828 type:complete len:127 (+) Transcript_32358:315-695(+)|eukprot:CAMPEP_0177611876 /NCGR_PEP_ID=MMETSP0419_2-20121207/20826_1 /TAXON_ID=582737 /ORGANISM="Tetraselmis sp., Strain GSL018" /LENGTH=126 /DNA_ID=CAMNT_0019107837 /DNA_START=253 /DNA_END=633 /DNA_ORIENTATION=+
MPAADTLADEENEAQEVKVDLQKKYKTSVISSHMTTAHEKDAIQFSLEGYHTYRHLKDIAQYIKEAYDKKYPSSGKATDGVYHCVVGRNFASAISHETRFYVHLMVETLHVILWKSKDSPFDLDEN